MTLTLAPTVMAHSVESPFIVPFVIGSNNVPIGLIKVWNDDTNLYVLFEIDEESYPDYAMGESHLEVSNTPLNWKAPGLWTYSHVYTPYAIQDLYTIPLASIDGGVGLGATIYLMAHATIYYRGIRIGSAYGLSFKGSFSYTIQEAPPTTPTLSIVKTGPLEAYPGGRYLYTIVVTNAGNCIVENVEVKDKLPDGVKPAHPEAPGTPTGVYDEYNNVISWSLGTLGINAIVVITFEVVLDSDLIHGTKLINNATAFGSNAYPVWDEWNTTVVAGPRLSIEKVGPIVSYPGDIITYTIAVHNIGNETAYNVQVTDTIDLSLVEYVSSTPIGAISVDKVTWHLGTLNKGVTMLITLVVRVRETVQNGTTIRNAVEVTWKDYTGQTYPTEYYEWITRVLSNPHLDIFKSGPLNAHPNQIIEYTISVVNLGGSSAFNVTVSDKLPPGTTYVGASPTPTLSNNQWVNWTIPEIRAGQTITFTIWINMTVYPITCQYVINNVTTTWKDALGRTYGPKWDASITSVCSSPLLVINKTGDQKGTINQILSFTINVTNIGGSRAVNARIWDDLPYNLTLISSSPNCTFYDIYTGRIVWEFEAIEPGETISIFLTVNVSDAKYDGIWVFNNVYANWTSDEGIPYGPITDIHPIQLFVNPYVKISKSGPAEARVGAIVTYTITLSNPTQTKLSDMTLVDYLCTRVSYVSSSPSGTYDSATHTVTWPSLSINPGETLTFQVVVRVNPDLPEGTLIVNEAVVTWPAGSEMDTYTTRIIALPPSPPVGGTIVSQPLLQILAAIIIVIAAAATTITIALKKSRTKRTIIWLKSM